MMSRLGFVALVAALVAAPALAALDPTDEAVLNFALNLEYLEANFYHCAAYGEPIDASLWGANGVAPSGCKQGQLSQNVGELAKEIAADELGHVKLLRAVLGDAAVDQPAIDIGNAFKVAANAAASLAFNQSVTLTPDFDPYANDIFFFHGAFIFEDVGATAYAGAAALLVDKTILTAAAQILAVESYHAGSIRTNLARLQNKVAPFTGPVELRIRTVVDAISALRDFADNVGNTDDKDQGVVTVDLSGRGKARFVTNVVPTIGEYGLIATRDTNEVLRIVYLGADDKGGFFPNGLNGAIAVVSA